jgi:plasmid stabilization system protein ParE
MAVIVLAPADDELRHAQEWYEARRHGLGDKLFADFMRSVALVEAFPNAWDPVRGNFRRIRLNGFPYSVVYRLDGIDIVVTALVHHSRRLDYWRDR